MIPELDAIKARKADGEPLRHGDLTKLLAALEAVLELHQPYITRSAWQTCNECWNSGTAEIVYPCPTVAAIHGALKEEQPCTTN